MTDIIDKLICYAGEHLFLRQEDEIYLRNQLIHKLNLTHYSKTSVDETLIKSLEVPDSLILELKEHLKNNGHTPEEEIDFVIGDILGLLTPNPAVVNDIFDSLFQADPKLATDFLYDLQVKNDYIKKTFVETNIKWVAPFEDNYLEITINMSKPEKRNEDIAKLVMSAPGNSYPKCVLCADNIGYFGRSDHPSRMTLRTVELNLDGCPWFFQFSPYVYYSNHCIVIDQEHVPMVVNRKNLSKLFAFVDQFPHYFMGSNSDLPIVGGSILNHEHFQGGAHIMPIMKALPYYEVKIKKIPEVKLEALSWFGTAITITGKDKNKILDAMDLINSKWRIYNNPALDIISKTNLQHSTTTTIVRKIKDQYVAYVLLRNNRADERYPSGIFHAHQEHHGIKSEGIGLIEAGGLFILPARLKRQFQLIEDGFAKGLSGSELLLQNKELSILSTLIKSITPNGKSIKEQITLFVNDTCKQILINTAVFKPTKEGRAAFKDFLLSLNE